MKTVSEQTYDAITNDYHNEVGTVLHAEWPMSRFYNTKVDNTPSEDDEAFDIEYFPIDSITEPNRPTSGICKAVTGQAFAEPEGYSEVPRARFYMVGADDEYQYWQSPKATDSTGLFPVFNAANFPQPVGSTYAYDSLTSVRPTVTYITEDTENAEGEPVDGTPIVVGANKITFTIENTFSYPTDYDVEVRYTTTGAWTKVATNPEVPSNGRVELYYNGTAWTTTKNLDHKRNISAVRLVVRRMNVPPVTRNVSLRTIKGLNVLIGPSGGFSNADINASVTGAGIPAGTKILRVDSIETSSRRWLMNNGTVVNQSTRPTNAKMELDPVITSSSLAAMSKPATASASGVNASVTVVPAGVFFNLIELGVSLERDLTPDLINWSDQFSMGEVDFITPLGNISSNTGAVSLWNGENGRFRNNNADSEFYGILDRAVVFRCWMKYGDTLVPEFEMFSDSWDENDDSTSVSLVDGAGFFMETKPPAVLYQNVPVQEAIWRICDIVGFNNYEVSPVDQSATIDIFWTDGEKTAWEVFGELSRATQTAIYFDSAGRLQVKTRDKAWDKTKDPSYDFLRNTIPGGQPANIVTLSETTEHEANKVTINWQPTGFSETRDNIVPFSTVWEPDGDTVLRSTPLAQNVLKNDTIINLRTAEGKTWPYKGIMNLEGEFISFDAKRYVYHDKNGVRKSKWVENHDDQRVLDVEAGPFHRHLNNYTGALRVEQRGLWGTEPKDHRIDLGGWTKTRRRNYATNASPCGGIALGGAASHVTITGKKDKNSMNDYTYLHRGTSSDTGYRYLGTRLRVDKTSHKDKVGGIFFASGSVGSGYFLEVMATSRMDGKMRNTRNEVLFYSMKADGSKKVFGGDTIKIKDKSKNHKKGATVKKDVGSRLAVVANRYIDFDIWFTTSGGTDTIQVFANGRHLLTAKVEGTWRHANVGRVGLFARGHSSMTFDHFYAVASPGVEMIDSESYWDRMDGGYYSTQAGDWTYDTRTVRRRVKVKKKKRKKGKKWKWKWKKFSQRYSQRLYEEFGPMAHEVREFDIKFTSDTPVLESKLYFSNTTQAVCTEYTGGISGANFIMANISRFPAVLSGDDARTAGGNGTINHKLFVYGRPVIQKDALTLVKEDAWSIRRRGIIEVEYSSPWIQNKDEAERFGDWLTSHWSHSDSTLTMEVFGNPLIELTDVVRVKYDHIDAYFYVTGVSNNFENGLTTQLTLRKAEDA